MTISTLTSDPCEPIDARCDDSTLCVELADGRSISVPLSWFPRLAHGTPAERSKIERSAGGLHWPELNEDISVEALLRGEKSGESAKSIERWLKLRAEGKREIVPTYPLNEEINGQR